MNRRRSSSLNRRARRRPTRLAGSSPASAHRRNDASLARRNRAASRVVSNLSLNALRMTVMLSTNGSECHTQSHIIQAYARVPRRSRTDGLTAREVEILQRVTSGLTNRQLAEELGVSTRTIDAHLRSVYAKLGVKSRSAATRYAIEHHLV